MSRQCLVMSESKIVEIERSVGGSFGFSVIGGIDTELPPMICALVHNGSAQLSGKVSHFRLDILPSNSSSCQPVLELCYRGDVLMCTTQIRSNLRSSACIANTHKSFIALNFKIPSFIFLQFTDSSCLR